MGQTFNRVPGWEFQCRTVTPGISQFTLVSVTDRRRLDNTDNREPTFLIPTRWSCFCLPPHWDCLSLAFHASPAFAHPNPEAVLSGEWEPMVSQVIHGFTWWEDQLFLTRAASRPLGHEPMGREGQFWWGSSEDNRERKAGVAEGLQGNVTQSLGVASSRNKEVKLSAV